jgi:NAD(P)-dependent dehydrogenase (short-subunit alcohol dehydrogenase family)
VKARPGFFVPVFGVIARNSALSLPENSASLSRFPGESQSTHLLPNLKTSKTMNLQLENKTALVTGSTKGIGLAIAKALAAEGAKVIVNGRSEASVQAAAGEVGNGARGVAGDVSTAAGCEALITGAGQVDILVNNAGIFEPKPFVGIPDADWERFYQVNVMSAVRLTRALLPARAASRSRKK